MSGDGGKHEAIDDDPRFALVRDIAQTELEGSGEGVFTVERTILSVARAYGLDVGVLVLPVQLLLTARAEQGYATAVVRATPGISRLDRVDALHRLVFEIRAGLPLAEARRQLDALRAAPIPYPTWLRVIGVALFAGGFAPSVVGTAKELGVATLLGLLMGVIVMTFEERRLSPLLPFVGAFVVATVTLTVFGSVSHISGPVLLMLPALFVVLPGDYLSGAVGELAIGRIVPGATRLIWALFLLLQLLIGILVADQITGRGLSSLTESAHTSALPFWVETLGWIPFSIGLAWTFNAPERAIPWMTGLVIGTFLVQRGADLITGELTATIIAGVALGAVATTLSRSPTRPARLLLFLGGFFVLTVGALGLRGLAEVVAGHSDAGVRDLLNLLLLVPTVSLGLMFGYLIAPRRLPAWLSPMRKRPLAGRPTTDEISDEDGTTFGPPFES
jgi:uncharacterized membrane protein YjjP (DUF1212 family)